MYYLTGAQRRLFIILSWADWMQVFVTLGLTKISICLFLLRIIESRRMIKGMYVLIGFTALFSAVSFFIFIGVCRPLRAYWDVGVDGHCLSNTQIEATIIAQGSKSNALNTLNGWTYKIPPSSFNPYRSYLRSPSVNFPAQPSSQPTKQDRTLHLDGSRRHVSSGPCG